MDFWLSPAKSPEETPEEEVRKLPHSTVFVYRQIFIFQNFCC